MNRSSARERRRRLAQLTCEGVIAEIDDGRLWAVYIDDTGPGGSRGSSDSLPPDRSSYVAAIVPAASGREFASRFRSMQAELEAKSGEREFHSTEVYNGKRGFRDMALFERIGYFDAFAELAEALNVTFIVQSMDRTITKDWFEALQINYPPLRKAFNLEEPSDLALFLLLLQVQDHLKLLMPSHLRAAVFIDEGWKKRGTGVWIGALENEFLNGFLMSASSIEVPGLQFADFAAFMLNRSQRIFGNKSLSKPDMWITRIWSRLGVRFQNVQRRQWTVQEAEGGGLRLVLAEKTTGP